MIEARGDKHTADFVRTYADFLESHIETVDGHRSRHPGAGNHADIISESIPRRVTVARAAMKIPDTGELVLANQKPGDRYQYPANQIVDAGFLELVRFGIRKPGDPLIEDSLKVVDARVEGRYPVRPLLEAL